MCKNEDREGAWGFLCARQAQGGSMRNTAKRLMVVAMAMAMVVALPAVALAHHPLISAEPDCMLADGSWDLDYTAWAWESTPNTPNPTDDHRTNNDVGIYLGVVRVGSGAFNVGNGFTFTGSIHVPSGVDPATLRAVAEVQWGVGENLGSAGEYAEIIVDMPDPCPEGPGTGTPGYWHKLDRWVEWEIDGVTVGGIDYTAAAAVNIINAPVKGDKTLTMFPALVAAMNNVTIGNDASCIASTITAADAWMTDNAPGDGVKANSDAWDVGGPLASMLDQYNNGYLCAPHRD